MNKRNLLREYKINVQTILNCAKKSNLKDQEIEKLLHQSFNYVKPPDSKISISQHSYKICVLLTIFLSLFLYVLLNVHTPTSSIVLRNVQGLTYPALKIVHTLSVPIMKLFPSLTDLYDESCLVENPYFHLVDMECWPCENVHSVLDLTGIEGINAFEKASEGAPFIIKATQEIVYFKDLQQMYNNYSSELICDSNRLKTNSADIKTINELFSLNEGNLSSYVQMHWRINKMRTARIIRNVFPKPHFFPERTGQAVERFLHIDGSSAKAYTLPNTECSYVFIIQGSGERTIVLKPAKECKEKCKTVSVSLKPSYVLFYNWWYWRPVSLPAKNDMSLSISYINSFC